jgi:hypothetical protein
MINQAFIFKCDKLSPFNLLRPDYMGMPVKLSNHVMIQAKVPYFSGLKNNF